MFVQNAWCAVSINAGINKHNYITGENLSASGYVSEGTSGYAGTVIFAISNSTDSSVVSESVNVTDGSFSKTIDISNLPNGDYNITLEAGSQSIMIDFKISSTHAIITVFLNSSKPIVSCSPDDVSKGIIVDSSIGQNLTCNFTVDNNTHYAIVENSSDTPYYDTVYLDDDPNMTFTNDTMFKYLSEGDSFIVDDKEISVLFISHDGSRIIIGDKLDSDFNGGENIKIMAI
ncbi:MAG: hypothetical protein KAQ92_00730, partial [Candidatus Aenigmarchaeota archaeon]|nr:hypothetical protein [Candidatus Aenigmarchaeota archaeon]